MTSENQRPEIYVIAGPNGAGKTTFASRFLPEYVHCTEFLNADLIAAGLSPFDPESQNIRASELMLERMDGLIERRETFSFETTLAARSYRHKNIGWRDSGYYVHLFFLWLPSADMPVARVANRVIQGGGMDCLKKRSETAMIVESPISMLFTGLWSMNGRVLTALGYPPG